MQEGCGAGRVGHRNQVTNIVEGNNTKGQSRLSSPVIEFDHGLSRLQDSIFELHTTEIVSTNAGIRTSQQARILF